MTHTLSNFINMVADCGDVTDQPITNQALQPSGDFVGTFPPPIPVAPIQQATQVVVMPTQPVVTVNQTGSLTRVECVSQPIQRDIPQPVQVIQEAPQTYIQTQVVSRPIAGGSYGSTIQNPFANPGTFQNGTVNNFGVPGVNTESVEYIASMLGVQKQDLTTKAETLLYNMKSTMMPEHKTRHDQLSSALRMCVNDEQRAYVIQEIERLESSMKGAPITSLMVDSVVNAGEILFGQQLPGSIKKELCTIAQPYISNALGNMPGSNLAPIIMTGVEVGLMTLSSNLKEYAQSVAPPKMPRLYAFAKKM